MEKTYNIIYEAGSGEIVEKKSRFIAHIYPVDSIEEAEQIKEQIKKKYWDARHNCTAYVIGKNNEIQRYDDDGEPSGTAGKPMLDILLSSELRNCIVVVTRYFGGVLLGTGGLIRAYQAAVKGGLQNTKVVKVHKGIQIGIQTDYTGLGKIQYITANEGAYIKETEYLENVNLSIIIEENSYGIFEKKVTEATNGKAVFHSKQAIEFGILENECILL